MKKITQNLRWLVTLLAMIVCTGAWAQNQNYEWWETDITSLETGDVVVIVEKTHSTAMANDGGGANGAPAATKVTFDDYIIQSTPVSANLQWEVTVSVVDNERYYQFNVPNSENYLYCTNTNNGVRVGTNTNNTFTFDSTEKLLINTATNRYVGVYSQSDWRCYTTINSNIQDNVTAFYKRVESSTPPSPTYTITISDEKLTNKDVYAGTNAGKLSATVKEGDTTIENPSITWTSSNTSVATISTMGAVTLVAAGTTTITAAYNGSTATYELVVTNSAPVIDYATLPFEFDGGKSDIASTVGLTHEGLDSDYSSAPKLKFNSTGDWVLLKINEVPGDLSFDIKGNSFSGGTFTVQTSVDGETYTDLATYTELGSTQSETFNNLSSDVRYIKWIYTTRSSGNVALGNIKLEKYTTEPQIIVNNTTIDVDANENEGTLEVTYKNIDPDAEIYFYAADGETTATYDWIIADFNADGDVEYVIEANDGEARTAYLKVYALDAEANDVYSDLITINQAAYVAPPTPTGVVYTKVTSTDDITDGQYLIVYEGANIAFNGSLGTLDAAGNTIDVEINDNTIAGTEETEAAEFTINVTEGSLKSASGYYIGVSSNSNGLKQTEDATTYTNTFSIDNDENAVIAADFTGSTMKLLFNTNGRFRYYSSINQTNKAIQLYKKVVETAPSVTIGDAKWATYVAEDNVAFLSVSAYTVETINTSSVTLGEVLAVKKGTPVLVYSENPGTYTLEVVDEEDCDETYNNKLKVSDGTVAGSSSIYALANQNNVVGFYPVSSTITIPEGKAYLDTSSAKHPVKGFLALGDFADAINNIAVETANGTIFNIAGQKVQNITKGGLYIVNGKKVVVK